MRWLPVIFTIGTWYLSATSAMRRSSAGVVTPPRMRGIDGERAVLLDVRVDAIVDESRRAILVVIAAPQHVEHVAQRRLADLAARAVAVDVEHLLHRLQPLAAQDLAQVVLRERHAAAQHLLAFLLEVRRDRPQQVLAQRRAAAAARCWRACTPSAATAC